MTNNILILLVFGTVGWQQVHCRSVFPVCRPHILSQCSSLNYNTTLPNLRGQTTPSVIEKEFLQFEILFRYNCSNALLVFLCAVYAPLCGSISPNSTPVVLKPCRNICNHVYDGCIGVFNEFQYQWPEALACENFPERNEERCFGPPDPLQIEYPTLVSANATIPLPTSPEATTSSSTTDKTLSYTTDINTTSSSAINISSPTIIYLMLALYFVYCVLYHMI